MAQARTHKPVPLTTPLQIRDATVRDYVRQARRVGDQREATTIEAEAKADLEMVDAYHREGTIKTAEAPAKPKKPAKRSNELEEHLAEHNMRQRHREVPDQNPLPTDIADKSAVKVDLKWAAAGARIARILEPRDKVAGALATSFTAKIKACAYPKLAAEYMDVYAARQFAMMEFLPASGNTLRDKAIGKGKNKRRNPFFGLSAVDSQRLFRRCVEDICDKSVAEPGLRHWWVK